MALCFYKEINEGGMPVFGKRTLDLNQLDLLVSFCKEALGDIYSDMWIDPEYFDDKYIKSTDKFYAEVGMTLYPRYTDLEDAFKGAKVPYPKDKDGWNRNRNLVYSTIHKDIVRSSEENRYPIYIVVKGKKTKSSEKIVSVQIVPKLTTKGNI